MQLIADFEGTMLWPMIALSNIAQGSAVLGMAFLQRKNANAQEVNVPSCISCYLGVTEPAIFGVNLKHTFPFVCGMIGSACAAVVCVATSTTANAIGVGGWPGILSIQPAYMGSFAICTVIAVAVPFILTCVVGKTKLAPADIAPTVEAETEAEPAKSTAGKVELSAYLSGKVIAIDQVPDQVFSQKVLGDGLAIEPTDSVLLAPADGEITVVNEGTNHACGILLDNGAEILLHIGLDTVGMNGDGFMPLVKEGDKVKRGDKLIAFDPEKIKAAGHPCVTVLVVTEEADQTLQMRTGMVVQAGQDIILTMGA
ncbi:MAG: PTS beta-glucoside transporter subunit IIBCA [Oscillospiraceae bacterium]|nr:PTS beta-glucoside transporter subunit IIBCA [Oscillospiraceae bacterium]